MPRTLLPRGVEQRREDADAAAAGHDRADAAADAALGGQAHAIGPFAGVVVHAAGEHDAEHVFDVLPVDGPLFGDGIHAGVGERRAHHGQVVGVDQDRALLKIQLERIGDLLADHAEVEHQVRDRAVAVAGGPLGEEDRVVDVAPRGRCSGRTWPAVRLMRSAKSLPWTRSAVAMAPAFTSGLKGRFETSSSTMALNASPVGSTPDLLEHLFAAVIFQRQAEHERLGDSSEC